MSTAALVTLLRCPACRSTLDRAAARADDVDRLACRGCGAAWPVRWGIPDLRPPGLEDPYLTRDADLRAAERLVERAATSDFAGVLAAYYETNDKVPAAQARQFIAGTLAALGRAEGVLRAWRDLDGLPVAAGAFLVDVGCGTGPLAVAALAAGFRVVALDVGLRWLVLAQARAREAGMPLPVACAHAARLPLPDAAVDVMASEYLVENVVPAGPAIAEAARVLRPDGRLWCSTANRWSPGPDPHLGALFAGWWSDARVARYAASRGLVPPRRHLFSARGLRRLLVQHGFAPPRTGPVPVSRSQRDAASRPIRLAVDAYTRLGTTAAGRALLTVIGPSLITTASPARQAAAS